MENNKAPLFTFSIIAIILGVALHKQFDYENFKFEKPALAIVYFIVFAASVFFIIKGSKATTNTGNND
ncbi:hypothetical protein IDJ75_19175 [Mucilaginibacter rigui]|uniref:ATP synthase F0 sector subunit C n=1 Tax=Mucilaginibacter rigui TaxID=534635 RepID=A0ABR7XA54_9SPHI|nr:hypothetical protein [Mucilaginibacter rigui]MBD1387416.1 hypothetical protein [Mucilaginibacter rigui]